MKKYIFLTIAISLSFTFQSMAQRGDAQHGNAQRGNAQRTQLKGPAAKNYKPWKEVPSTKAVLATHHEKLKGPKAKNSRPWKQDLKMYPVVFAERIDLKGPNAKNQRQTSRTEYLSESASIQR